MDEASDRSGLSKTKLWRIESLEQHVSGDDVHALCAVYDTPADRTQALALLARQSKRRDWWHVYDDDDVLGRSTDVLELESDGVRVNLFNANMFPGLAQCEAYARAVIKALFPHETAEQHEARLRLRMERQRRAEANGLLMSMVLDASVFDREIGGHDVLAEQIAHIGRLAEDPRHTIQVIPHTAGVPPTLSFGYYVLRDRSTYVYFDTVPGGMYHENPEDVDLYAQAWSRYTALADTPTASARYWNSTTPDKTGTQHHADQRNSVVRRLRHVDEG